MTTLMPHTLGDVHLGKRFATGVPLHRRGDREAKVWQQFHLELLAHDRDMHVQVGDLFDNFTVPEAVILKAARAYRDAATAKPKTTFILFRGNHDASRDTALASSFDVFAEILKGVRNIRVLTEPTIIGEFGFLPWSPFKSATELAHELVKMCGTKRLRAVYCHCDVDSFGGDDFNLIPTGVLKYITPCVVTGHIHKPTYFTRDGVEVEVTGSMQPYSHSEDDEGRYYKTYTLAEVEQFQPGALHNMNIRVKLRDGELLPEVDCLSLVPQRWVEDSEASEQIQVEFEEFDMQKLFANTLVENKVSQSVSEKIMGKFLEIRNAQ